MPGVQWFAPQPHMPGEASHPGSSFGSPAAAQQVLQIFGTGPDGQQIYPASAPVSAPPFGTEFPPQQEQIAFPNPGNHMPAGEQNPGWGDTLNMWSTAPTGFEWEDWNNFTTNMIPRPDEQNPPS